jgi:hypothetical protein
MAAMFELFAVGKSALAQTCFFGGILQDAKRPRKIRISFQPGRPDRAPRRASLPSVLQIPGSQTVSGGVRRLTPLGVGGSGV